MKFCRHKSSLNSTDSCMNKKLDSDCNSFTLYLIEYKNI